LQYAEKLLRAERMRLLYITNARIPTEKAHGLQIVKMCEAFARLGVDVELVVPVRVQPESLRNIDAFEYYDVERIFKIKKIPIPDAVHITRYLPGKAGNLVFHIHSLLFSLSAALYTLIKRPDIVLTRDPKAAFILSFFSNTVYESHTYPESVIDSFLEKNAYKRCKIFIVITENLKNAYKSRGFSHEKMVVLHDCVDLKKYDLNISREYARRRLKIDRKSKIVMYTGHLYPWKGVYTLIDASKYLGSEVRVVLVGGLDEDIKKIREYIKKERDIRNVDILGHVNPAEIPLYLKAADVLVLPNSGRYEKSLYYTSPLKLFEYMASRRPIVASDLPAFREILNEDSAVFFKPDDPISLAESIKRVLRDRKLAEKISENAYKIVKKYTWENRCREILKFVRKE